MSFDKKSSSTELLISYFFKVLVKHFINILTVSYLNVLPKPNSLLTIYFRPQSKINKYFLFSFLFLLTFNAQAQDQRFNAGLFAGFTAAQLNGDESAGYNKVGITGGIRGIIDLTDKWNLSTEILFGQRGSRYPTGPNNPGVPFNITTSYIDVPVYATIGDWLSEDEKYYRISLDMGAAFGRLISIETIDTPFDNNPEVFQKNDLYLLAGVRYMLNSHFAFNFRYNRSILFLFDPRKPPMTINQRALLSHFLTLKIEYIF